ncbi:hypothetical protein SARC_11835 [Sphaeroforma arctica JP610]|uniref:Methyltransferase domain-containing protein n=1 Tax=Sphaeroforma arctica JP610 TaxID=667725 RepID=A0A0L0FHZ5_9EUKA|nr:hypothetical protein SARC_11835 [Sphaeroforma arctica JP610]KNC75643.1 hypothetical protein SARC_11835 [Sphaeroforma arctica JP610]|eukprot:XP_014149545.1 hypothetical protein SARC_11835 [Sphaeroforma arctica JP610]
MWRWYFGEKFRYIGIDINPAVQQFKAPWATILIGDSGDPEFWAKIRADYPERPDIFLDDGGHTMTQQLNAFKYAYDWVKDDGIYACEDLHTSYMPSHGGKLYTLDEGGDHHPVQHKDTSKLVLMTDLIKNSVDYLHAQRNNNCGTNEVCKLTKDTLQSISLSESIVFYQKGPKSVLVCKTGGRSIPYAETDTKYEDMFMDDMLAVAQEGTGGACETGNRASMWKPRPGYEKMKSIINR